jgi:hypothetical protein
VKKFEIFPEMSKKFCPAIGNTVVISLCLFVFWPVKFFLGRRFLGKENVILWIPSWKKCYETLAYIIQTQVEYFWSHTWELAPDIPTNPMVTDSVMWKSKMIDPLRAVVSASAACTNSQWRCISPVQYFTKGFLPILPTLIIITIPAMAL